jgi:Flp pilus assembly protein TadD
MVIAHLLAGNLYLQQGNPGRALEAFTTATRLDPTRSAAHFGLGIAHHHNRDTERALASYRKALTLNPNDPRAYNNIAYVLAEQGRDLGEALSAAQRAAELGREAPSIMDTLGFVHYQRGEYDKAEPLLRRAAEQLRNNATVHYHLGMTYYRLGRTEEAAAALRRSLQIDERFVHAQRARQLLKDLGA